MFKKLTAFTILTVFFCFLGKTLGAQILLPPNQPEQDACTAIVLCGSKFSTPYSYQGNGRVLDLQATNSCNSGEDNSMWMKLQVVTSGKLLFNIVPVDPLDDYDFAVANVTNTSCDSLSYNNVVRYNFNSNEPGSNVGGVVGLNLSSTQDFICDGVLGSSFAQYINAVAGETYLIMINNFGHDDNPGPSKGFTIDFTGSTAAFSQPPPPAFSSINTPLCSNATSVTVQLTTQALCSSIAADGSDFTISPAVTITGAAGVNCSGANGYANAVTITFATPPAPGTYTLSAKQGSDGNTLLGLCSSELLLPSNITFTVSPPIQTVDSEFTCYNQLPYLWHGKSITQGGNNAATYTSTAANGCDSTVVLNLTVSSPPATSSISKTICAGQTYNLPWNDSTVNTAGAYSHSYPNILGCDSLTTTITVSLDNPSQNKQAVICSDSSQQLSIGPGFNNYTWGNGATTPAITISGPGIYTVQATDSLGCVASDTFNISTDVITAGLTKNIPLCQGTGLIITASPGFVSYLWSDGTTQQTFSTTSAGTYWVTVTDTHNCQATDTVTVASVPLPANFLIGVVIKCSYATVVLQAGNSYSKYLWSTGDTTNNIHVQKSGTYTLQVTDSNGCVATESAAVQDSSCPEYLYVPTAFTPNGDGHNDVFKPGFAGLAIQYNFIVYNRWGQKVFASTNPANGWDGNINGQPQQSGVYIWYCEYQLFGLLPQSAKGTVVLIR